MTQPAPATLNPTNTRRAYFLLTYDRSKLRLVDIERLRDGEKAIDLYSEREHQYADQRTSR